ncbi:hypothetical protein ACOME3_003253 [Neoechinorhynchus agilis]
MDSSHGFDDQFDNNPEVLQWMQNPDQYLSQDIVPPITHPQSTVPVAYDTGNSTPQSAILRVLPQPYSTPVTAASQNIPTDQSGAPSNFSGSSALSSLFSPYQSNLSTPKNQDGESQDPLLFKSKYIIEGDSATQKAKGSLKPLSQLKDWLHEKKEGRSQRDINSVDEPMSKSAKLAKTYNDLKLLFSIFKSLDANNDGMITKEDFIILMQKQGMGSMAKPIGKATFKALDADKDGRLTFADFSGILMKIKNKSSGKLIGSTKAAGESMDVEF